MRVKIKCPNGHTLTADESKAGKHAKCPVCRAPVIIPSIAEQLLIESLANLELPSMDEYDESANDENNPDSPIRACPRCTQKIERIHRLCPHCSTFLS